MIGFVVDVLFSEFGCAEQPAALDGESKETDESRVAKKRRRPPKLLRIKRQRKEEVQDESLLSVDELCSLFELCQFASTLPRYFAKDEKVSLRDCLSDLRTRNVLSQKFIELNAGKSNKVKKRLPNLIPIVFVQDIDTDPSVDEYIRNGPPESMNSDEVLDIHSILKSITHVYEKPPYYVPYEEDWHDGFDSWGK